MDQFIDIVEGVFGTGNPERDRFPNNSFGGFNVTRKNVTLFHGYRQVLELGDLSLLVKRELPLGEVRPSLVADDAAGLARLMGTLYTNRGEWERAQAYLLDLGASRFDRASFQRTLVEALSHVGVAPPARTVAR